MKKVLAIDRQYCIITYIETTRGNKMEHHFVAIPFPLLAAREARISRTKYTLRAKSKTHGDREFELVMAKMMKRHEKQWLEVYQEDCCNA